MMSDKVNSIFLLPFVTCSQFGPAHHQEAKV